MMKKLKNIKKKYYPTNKLKQSEKQFKDLEKLSTAMGNDRNQI